MARHSGGFTHTVLSLAVLAVLAGCGGGGGGSSGTQNPPPSGPPTGSNPNPGNGDPPGTDPGIGNPGGPGNPGNPGNGDPGTPNPPTQIGQPATATANGAVLTSTRTTVYNLNSVYLNPSGWRPTVRLEDTDIAAALSPRVAFDESGNGLAVWAQGADVYAIRYSASSASWSSPEVIDNGSAHSSQTRLAVDRQSGNAIATWMQSDGVAPSLYVTHFDAASNSWSAPQVVETSDELVDSDFDNASISIAGAHAAVVWRQFDGVASSLYMTRLVNGSWEAPTVLDTSDEGVTFPSVAIDRNGNATAIWRQFDAVSASNRIHARRWDNVAQALRPIQLINTNGDRATRLQFDAQGNGIALWSGSGIYSRRYDVATDQWDAEVAIHNNTGTVGPAQLSVDAAGNALAVWVQNDGTADSMYGRYYDAAAGGWGSAQLLENSNAPVSILEGKDPTVSLIGDDAVVAWIQDGAGAQQDVYGIKLQAGTWGPVTLLQSDARLAVGLTSGVGAAGNASVLWVQRQSVDNARSIYGTSYLNSNVIVPAGATWQSLAETLYGVNSVEAGNALQAAMGGGALVEGAMLGNFPATLSVTTAVPATYTVLATDTWSHIAQTVYGVSDVAAIDRLRTLLGNPTLTAGLQLTVPAQIEYTTSENYSAALDFSRVNTSTTTQHQLDIAALTVPLDLWSAPAPLTLASAEAISPRVAFDAQGNGIAAWVQGQDVVARRYLASSGEWSSPIVLDANPTVPVAPSLALDRTTGNAVASWTQNDGIATSLYVSSFDASNGTWSMAQVIEATDNDVSANSSITISGEHAAVTWRQSDGTTNTDVYLSRLVSGTWTTPELIAAGSTPALNPVVAIDGNGNATVAWSQRPAGGGDFVTNTRRWDNATLTLGAVIDMNSSGNTEPRLSFDGQGNGVLLWQGVSTGTFVRHFDHATDQWSAQTALHTGTAAALGELSVDASGDALATWVEVVGGVSTIQTSQYDTTSGTWSAATAIADNVTASQMNVSLVNNSAVVSWVTQGGASDDAYAARMQDGAWGAATLLETSAERVAAITSGIGSNNTATTLWVQFDNVGPVIYQARSTSTPFYLVPGGATWQSLANALYGIDSADAGEAFATAMGRPTLTTGLSLQDPPTTLVVTSSLPTHYVVQSGDTWQSITQALYGTSNSEASTALWVQLGRPTLTVGQMLAVPDELAYTIDE